MATFLETPRFPDNIAFGATVGPTYLTVVTPVYSGRDGRQVAWTQSRIRFEVGRRAMIAADTQTLDAFFRVVKGRAYGFRIKDWTDFAVMPAQSALIAQPIAGVYQLAKVYATGALSETRLIQKPVVGTVAPYINGSLYTAGFSVDTTTGLITFSAISIAAVAAVTVGATTQIQLASALSNVHIGGNLYLTGLAGADAAFLNGQQFGVTNISGATYTISADTAGKTIAPGTGQGAGLPQPTDVLTWSGQFDVPVRFDVDEMKKQIIDRNGQAGDLLVDWGSIPIIEIRI